MERQTKKTEFNKFMFSHPEDVAGYPCDLTSDYVSSLTLFITEVIPDTSSSSSGDYNETSTSIYTPHTIVQRLRSDAYYGIITDTLKSGTTYMWKIITSNGDSNSVESSWFNFTTAPFSCSSLKCEPYGSCNYATEDCKCDDGSTGLSCSSQNSSLPTGAAIGIAIGGTVFFAALIALLVLLRKKMNDRSVLKMPDFSKYRYTSIGGIEDSEEILARETIEELVKSDAANDFAWSRRILAATSATEADHVCCSFVYLFEQQGMTLEFILSLIRHEVEETKGITVLFRANSNATKCFKVYSKLIGLEFMFRVLAPVLRQLLKEEQKAQTKVIVKGEVSAEFSLHADEMELNADAENQDASDIESNVLTLQISCQRFISSLSKTGKFCPPQFRRICNTIRSEVSAKFPDATASVLVRLSNSNGSIFD